VLFTYKDGNLYAMTPKWPGRQLRLKNVPAGPDTKATFLATGADLAWCTEGNAVIITLPAFDPNRKISTEAYAFRLTHITRPND